MVLSTSDFFENVCVQYTIWPVIMYVIYKVELKKKYAGKFLSIFDLQHKSHQAFVTSIITTMTKIVGKEKSNYLDYGIF